MRFPNKLPFQDEMARIAQAAAYDLDNALLGSQTGMTNWGDYFRDRERAILHSRSYDQAPTESPFGGEGGGQLARIFMSRFKPMHAVPSSELRAIQSGRPIQSFPRLGLEESDIRRLSHQATAREFVKLGMPEAHIFQREAVKARMGQIAERLRQGESDLMGSEMNLERATPNLTEFERKLLRKHAGYVESTEKNLDRLHRLGGSPSPHYYKWQRPPTTTERPTPGEKAFRGDIDAQARETDARIEKRFRDANEHVRRASEGFPRDDPPYEQGQSHPFHLDRIHEELIQDRERLKKIRKENPNHPDIDELLKIARRRLSEHRRKMMGVDEDSWKIIEDRVNEISRREDAEDPLEPSFEQMFRDAQDDPEHIDWDEEAQADMHARLEHFWEDMEQGGLPPQHEEDAMRAHRRAIEHEDRMRQAAQHLEQNPPRSRKKELIAAGALGTVGTAGAGVMTYQDYKRRKALREKTEARIKKNALEHRIRGGSR